MEWLGIALPGDLRQNEICKSSHRRLSLLPMEESTPLVCAAAVDTRLA